MIASTFGEWLLAYEGADSAIQDLRDDYGAVYRVNFRRRGWDHLKTPEHMMIHISMLGACQEAKDALKEAAVLYGEPLVGWDS